MPPKRKSRGKKRSRLSSAARGAKRRVSAAARYARRNPGRIAGGLAGLGYAGLEGYLAAKRHGLKKGRSFTGPQGLKEAIEFEKFKRSNPYASPTATAFRRGRRGVTAARKYFNDPNRDIRGDISRVAGEAYNDAKTTGRVAKGIFFDSWYPGVERAGSGFLDRLFPGRVQRRNAALELAELQRMAAIETDGRMRYGKRKRRRRRKKKFGGDCGFGKKAKKPSAATKRMCKKLKVRLTTKRGGKRVYKSEAMLKKQCKKAMKRKSKK